MPPPDLPPRFQLAFRRTVFFAMCLGIWLVIGALIFTGINILNLGGKKTNFNRLAKLDAKRTEFLNVLWAETIVRSENDWSEMANQKLELYEKALLSHLGYYRDKKDDSFMKSLRSSYLLITTTGPLVIDNFTTVGKIFAIAYALIGVPLCLTVVTQCGRMATSIWQGRSVLIPTSFFVFFAAIIYDIIEGGDDDIPFFDAIFSIFLQFSTVGEKNNKFHGVLPYLICLLGLSLMSATFIYLQHEIERSVHRFEISFSKVFSKFERWMSDEKDTSINRNRIEEEGEEEEEESDY